MSEVLFDSQRVLPKLTEAAGFQFRFPLLEGALQQLLR
jgi:NAD dependent epimerase/dehydratase family enzyme